MAMRRADDIAGRSLMRALAGLRSFGRFLEREGKGKVGALSAIRAPKVGKSLPKPIQIAAAKRLADADERAGETRETWILARDAAVMALLYGSGLRISEALGLKRRDVPQPGEGDVLIVTGKGNKTRMVPVLQNVLALIADYVAMCPHPLRAGQARSLSAPAAGRLSPRIIQLTMERMRGALGLPDSATPHALRHSFATHLLSPRRRSARDPGAARPRLALDHADLYRHRQRAAARSLSQRASARLTRRALATSIVPTYSRRHAGLPLAPDTVVRQSWRRSIAGGDIMSAHESMEHAEHAEHASGENRKIALLIAVIALCLALSETLGKGAQTESISKNVEASNLWAFFQAKSIRRTVVQTAAEQAKLSLGTASDDAAKAALQKQIDDWQKTAARYRSEPETGEGTRATGRTRQARRGRARPRDREISSLRTRLRRLPDRHRAGVRDHHHRHPRAGLGLGRADAWRASRFTALGLFAPHLLHLH